MPQVFAEVAVNSTFPHRQTFSYAVPEGLAVRAGHAAYVPFGRLTLQGIVLEVHDTPVFSEPEKIRAIKSLVGKRPLLDDDRVVLAKWIADYYVAPVFSAVALMLPPGFERAATVYYRAMSELIRVLMRLAALALDANGRPYVMFVVGKSEPDVGLYYMAGSTP